MEKCEQFKLLHNPPRNKYNSIYEEPHTMESTLKWDKYAALVASRRIKHSSQKTYHVPKKTVPPFHRQWLGQFRWLAYSEIMNVVICRVCVLFCKSSTTASRQKIPFVHETFNDWANAYESFKNHENTLRHRHFMFRYQNSTRAMKMQRMQEELDRKIEEGKNLPKNMPGVLKFLGRSEIPLKGLEENLQSSQVLLSNMEKDLKGVSQNRQNALQNELIVIFHSRISSHLVSKINKAKGFLLVLNVPIVLPTGPKLPLSVCYIKRGGRHRVKEDFIGAVSLGGDGKSIGEYIIRLISEIGLDGRYLCGVRSDRAEGTFQSLHETQAYIQANILFEFCKHSAQRSFSRFASAISPTPGILNRVDTMKYSHEFL